MYHIDELVAATGYTRSTIQTYSSLGLIPRPLKRGCTATWPRETLQALLQLLAEVHPDNRVTRACLAERAGLTPKGHSPWDP